MSYDLDHIEAKCPCPCEMLTESVEAALDVADKMAEETEKRYTHEEMFSKLRETVNIFQNQ